MTTVTTKSPLADANSMMADTNPRTLYKIGINDQKSKARVEKSKAWAEKSKAWTDESTAWTDWHSKL